MVFFSPTNIMASQPIILGKLFIKFYLSITVNVTFSNEPCFLLNFSRNLKSTI